MSSIAEKIENTYSWLPLAVLILITVIAHQKLIFDGYSVGDTLPLIYSSKIYEFSDVIRILTTPIMSNIGFDAFFYRPVSIFSFSLDYFIWGDNSFGFHLTNIILHWFCGFVLFILVKHFFFGNSVAFLASILFLIHPLTMEVVPLVARRQDILACLFSLVSFYSFLNWYHKGKAVKHILLSLICYLLALASKEISVFIPAVIWFYLIFYSCSPGNKIAFIRLVIKSTSITLLFIPILIFYIYLRFNAIGQIEGGYNMYYELWRIKATVYVYLSSFFYPQDFLMLNKFIKGESLLEVHFIIAALISTLVGIQAISTKNGRNLLFFVGWFLLPLFVLIATKTLAHRSFYSALIPFSILMSILVVSSVKRLKSSKFIFDKLNCLGIFNILVVISILTFSPLFHKYQEWSESNINMTRTLNDVYRSVIPYSDQNINAIYVNDIPSYIEYYKSQLPHAKTVAYIGEYVINAYLTERGISHLVSNVSFKEIQSGESYKYVETNIKNNILTITFVY